MNQIEDPTEYLEVVSSIVLNQMVGVDIAYAADRAKEELETSVVRF